ncbi:MAG: delta-aminolevulinic acid dehydratase [Thermoleophilaceae bacterium]
MTGNEIGRAAARTEEHLRSQGLRGYDPYDALCSPIFRLPGLRSLRIPRIGAQQALRRLPVNVRPLLGIPRQLNAISVALFLQGLAHRAEARHDAGSSREEAIHHVALLADLRTPGWSGSCWGYPFDWEARYASLPAGTPTVEATGVVAHALFEAHRVWALPEAAELVRMSVGFVLEDLNRTEGREGFCWSYSPYDRQRVVNVTLKGSRLLAQAHALGGPKELLAPAARSVAWVVGAQEASGRWPYAVGDARSWADNFHTGYLLECLSSYRRLTGDSRADAAIEHGWAYYRKRFFTSGGVARYYDEATYPVDTTSAAQALIVLCELGDLPTALRVAEAMVETLGRPDGSFDYQRRRWGTIRIPYLRWSSAWAYAGLARLERDAGEP